MSPAQAQDFSVIGFGGAYLALNPPSVPRQHRARLGRRDSAGLALQQGLSYFDLQLA